MADISATHSTGKDDWETPWWLVHMLEKEFGDIDLDPCATFESRRGAEFFTEADDGLSRRWFGNVFCNPPYSKMAKWAEKAFTEANLGHTENIFFLCAARTDTKAWWNWLRLGEVRFIKGRIKFIGGVNSAPFPSALVIFSHNIWKTPTTLYWDIPKEQRK